MSKHEAGRSINRRRLLRRAGTVAAAVAGAGAVGAIATPASAADGDPMVVGGSYTGGTATNPALKLQNTTGAALALAPITFPAQPNTAAPGGSLYTDDYGDVYGIGQIGGAGPKFATQLYSPNWATMTIPISPMRWVDTRNPSSGGLGALHLVGTFGRDSSGRLIPKGLGNPAADVIIDLSDLFLGGFGAVQANLTVHSAVSAGFASLWDQGSFPGTSSINYVAGTAIANFTQTLIGDAGTISFKTQRTCHFILDIVGFVVTDPFAQFGGGFSVTANGARAQGGFQKRRPLAR